MPLRYPPRLHPRPTRTDTEGEGDLEEVGSFDPEPEMLLESIEGAKRQSYAWMAVLLTLTVGIFLVLAITHAHPAAYGFWVPIFTVAAVTQTWRRSPGSSLDGQPPPGPAVPPEDTAGGPPSD